MNKKVNDFLHWLTWNKGVGFLVKKRHFGLGLLVHSCQCGQVWIFAIRLGRRRFGYRTHGDATPKILTYKDGGWWFPWQNRYGSGTMV